MSKRRKFSKKYNKNIEKANKKLLTSFRKKVLDGITIVTFETLMLHKKNAFTQFHYFFNKKINRRKIWYLKRKVTRDRMVHFLQCTLDVQALFKCYITEKTKYQNETKRVKANALYDLFMGDTTGFLERMQKEEKNMVHLPDFIGPEVLSNTLVAKDVMLHILEYIPHTKETLCSIGKTCKNIYLMFLMTWKSITIKKEMVDNISLVVLHNVKEIIIGGRISKQQLKRFLKHTKKNRRVKKIEINAKLLTFVMLELQQYNVHGFQQIETISILGRKLNFISKKVQKFKLIFCFPNVTKVHLDSIPFEFLTGLTKIQSLHMSKSFDFKKISVANHTQYPFLKTVKEMTISYQYLDMMIKKCPQLESLILYKWLDFSKDYIHRYNLISLLTSNIKKINLRDFSSEDQIILHSPGDDQHKLSTKRIYIKKKSEDSKKNHWVDYQFKRKPIIVIDD